MHDPAACPCRDRDTRVLRAIIAAASVIDAAHPPPDRHTDLHRPESGFGGNKAARLVDVLVREGILPGDVLLAAWMTLPGVPMAARTVAEVRAFTADVEAKRRQSYFAGRLARAVHKAVTVHDELERHLQLEIRQMRKRSAEIAAKEAGTYWRERDARRRAKQPTHILVDPDAWQAMKHEAHRQETTVGELVGGWVELMVEDPDHQAELAAEHLPNRDGKALVDMVSRIDVGAEEWAWAKRDAKSLGVRVARFVGLVVEDHVQYLDGAARPRQRPRRQSRPGRTPA